MNFMSPRINRVLVSGVSSRVVPVNQYMRNTIVQIGVSGTATWRVRWTNANVMRGETPVWMDPDAGGTGDATGVVTFGYPVRALLIEITAGDGAITAYIGQQAKGGFSSGGASPPDLTNVEGLLRFETDQTTDDAGAVWSLTGTAALSSDSAEGGQSIDLSADNAYLRTDSYADRFKIDGDFCAEIWFKPNDLTGLGGTLFAFRAGNPNPTVNAIYAYVSGSGIVLNRTTSLVAAVPLVVGEWNHIALVRDGVAANNLKLYIGGVLNRQGTWTADFSSAAHNVTIGYDPGITGQRLRGLADFFRFTYGVPRYTAPFTPPTSA